jgi:hypothetical protein
MTTLMNNESFPFQTSEQVFLHLFFFACTIGMIWCETFKLRSMNSMEGFSERVEREEY